ncbi:DUF1403 family protein [Shimia aestuarii]|uniref:DUF1403 family protein n=1 Tax=Shimia aestuarii TaxID=254406 RepID=A0A1I4T753_9RHOB|nr:DUF1403 family protein [Shimia aestuarii]SFM72574.1 Protein of unknown function [Shimia aestuarii]
MTYAGHALDDDLTTLPRLPAWVTVAQAETPEDVAFLSGAALTHLHLLLQNPTVPASLLRDRLALLAADACLKRAGRSERAAELRDEVHLARPGDTLGPGGAVFANWRAQVRAPLKSPGRGQGAPIVAAAIALQEALNAHPGDEGTALMVADAALSASLGWRHTFPLVSLGLSRRDLQKRDAALQQACSRAVLTGSREVAPLVQDLARRVSRLREVAPKLRAKGAGAAVRLFEEQDALSPSLALSPIVKGSTCRMTGRSARRLCDRLVELGAVRELTGRDTFRLYGL